MHAEIAQMTQQASGGKIINTASICGLVALPQATAYHSAKHGVVGLTKFAAIEYATNNIRVNPACQDTPMLAQGAGASIGVLKEVTDVASPVQVRPRMWSPGSYRHSQVT